MDRTTRMIKTLKKDKVYAKWTQLEEDRYREEVTFNGNK